jgi:hypothetical protein
VPVKENQIDALPDNVLENERFEQLVIMGTVPIFMSAPNFEFRKSGAMPYS